MPKPRSAYVFDKVAFIPHPALVGVWLRVHVCVLETACELQGCGAKAGELCRDWRTGEIKTSFEQHHVRRSAYAQGKRVPPTIKVYVDTSRRVRPPGVKAPTTTSGETFPKKQR